MITPRVVALAILALSTAARAQHPRNALRSDRVVIYSPHFDIEPEPYGGLSCPAQPLRLYGFESPVSSATTTLLVRLFGPDNPLAGRPHAGVPGEPIRLARQWVNDRFVPLPASPTWRVLTDSQGGAVLRAPPGIYELEIVTGAPIGRGIVQIRGEHSDSVHAYILPRALC